MYMLVPSEVPFMSVMPENTGCKPLLVNVLVGADCKVTMNPPVLSTIKI